MFRPVFIAVVIAFALIVGAFLINRARPRVDVEQPTADFVRASGKCAECHTQQQYSVVHEYEMSRHAQKGVNCLDCHQPAASAGEAGAPRLHRSSTKLTAGNCRSCHEPIYQEFLRSRHAAPSWAAVYGEQGLTPEQVRSPSGISPAARSGPPHPLVDARRRVGDDERLRASATASASRTTTARSAPAPRATRGTPRSVAIARLPTTCGQCHMGPDHSQLEIYEESKHGVMFHAQERLLKLDAPPKSLTTRDMFVPTCATCHMSGLNGQKVTHDPSRAAVVLPRRSDHQAAAEQRSRPGAR